MEITTVQETTLSIYGVLSRVRSRRMDGEQQNAGQRGMNRRSERKRTNPDYKYLHMNGGDDKHPIVFHDPVVQQQDDEPVQLDAGSPMSPGMQANAEAYAANEEQQQQQQQQQPEEQEQEQRSMQRERQDERQREKEPQEPVEQPQQPGEQGPSCFYDYGVMLSGTEPAEFCRVRCIRVEDWLKEQQQEKEQEEQRKKQRQQPKEHSTAVGGSAK